MDKVETITIPPIRLEWSDWVPWDNLNRDARKEGGVRVPNRVPGVYEVRAGDSECRLTVGRTSNLRFRIKQALVRGIAPHPAGEKIRANEDVSSVVVRWAQTQRPAAVEEELHIRHIRKYGELPKYTGHT